MRLASTEGLPVRIAAIFSSHPPDPMSTTKAELTTTVGSTKGIVRRVLNTALPGKS
jgi:hypothetical protein